MMPRSHVKSDWSASGAFSLLAHEINKISRMLERVHIVNGSGYWAPDGIHITVGAAGVNDYAFRWAADTTDSVEANQISIGAGYCEGRYGYMTIPGAIVTCGGSKEQKHLIIAEGNRTGGAVVPVSVAEHNFAGDTATTWRRALYRVYLVDGVVKRDAVCAGALGIII